MTQLYCIGTDDGFIKVGLSENPEIRMAQLQTGNHRKLKLLHPGSDYDGMRRIGPEFNALEIERATHRLLKDQHTRGEWFEATLDDFMAAIHEVQLMPSIIQEPRADTGPVVPRGDGKFNKAAWMRAAMPAYMKRYRAEVKSGLRVPKPRANVPS